MKKWAFILLVGLASCYTENKARQQFSKAAIAYPKLPADYCATTYPVNAVTDSTDYKNSKRIIDSLASALLNDSLLSNDERIRLTLEIERVRSLIVEPKNCDSLSNTIYKLVSREKQRCDKLQSAYNNLLVASQNLKPVHDTVENTAKLKACELDNSQLTSLLIGVTADRDKYKAKANKRGWMFWGLIFLIIGAIGTRIYLKSKSIIK